MSTCLLDTHTHTHTHSFFGEIALLVKGERTASARAESYVEVFKLDKATFDEALHKFPQFKSHFHRAGECVSVCVSV